jgi:hypothetical protein
VPWFWSGGGFDLYDNFWLHVDFVGTNPTWVRERASHAYAILKARSKKQEARSKKQEARSKKQEASE